MVSFLGLFAGLCSPLTMTIGFFIWDKVWKGSPFSLNLFKCSLASAMFLAVALGIHSGALDDQAGYEDRVVGMLIVSSLLGIIIGDYLWLRALRDIGPRRVILMDSLKPFLGAVLGRIFLSEPLVPFMLFGMLLTVSGVLLVSLSSAKNGGEKGRGKGVKGGKPVVGTEIGNNMAESELGEAKTAPDPVELARLDSKKPLHQTGGEVSKTNPRGSPPASLRDGYTCAVLNVFFDAIGFVLTKFYAAKMTTIDINLIRFGFAAGCMVVASASLSTRSMCRRVDGFETENSPDDIQTAQNAKPTDTNTAWWALPSMAVSGWWKVALGVFFVTFMCPALSNYALFKLDLGLTLTLLSLGPIYALPLGRVMKGEAVTWRGVLGACLAVGGVVALAFSYQVDQNRF